MSRSVHPSIPFLDPQLISSNRLVRTVYRESAINTIIGGFFLSFFLFLIGLVACFEEMIVATAEFDTTLLASEALSVDGDGVGRICAYSRISKLWLGD